MADLAVSVILQAVDKMTAPVRHISKATGNLTTGFTNVQKRLADLNKKATQVQGFADLKKKTHDTHQAFTEATKKVGRLAHEINQAKKPTQKLTQQFEKAKRQAGLLKREFQRESKQLQLLRTDLTKAGISTRHFAVEQRHLKNQIEVTTNMLQKQQAFRGSLSHASARLGAVAEKTRHVAREAGKLGVKFAAVGGMTGWAFKRQFMDTAAQFEQYQTILETTEGSKEAAKKSMNWVSDFAAKTPFELAQVMDAFVKLRAYGLEPTKGLLTTLGDTSSAMGKDVIQAVEAIADAVTGENERLKEFGVKAHSQGNTITYEYTDKEGIQQALSVDKNDRKAIEEALTEIFNEKYAGSMDRLSKTWSGMISNVADQWTRFKNKVMEAGVFDFMKTKLQGLLEKINQLAESGQLQEYAKSISDQLIAGMKAAWAFGKALVEVSSVVFGAMKTVADSVGGFKVLLGGIAALMAGKLILSTIALGQSLLGLGVDSCSAAKYGLRFLIEQFKFMNASMAAFLKNAVPSFIAKMNAASLAAWHFGKRSAMAAVAGLHAMKRSFIATGAAAIAFAKNPMTMASSGMKKLSTAMVGLASGAIHTLIGGLRALTITLATHPLGLLVIAVSMAAVAIYQYWDHIKAFVGGIVEGFTSAAAPIMAAFKPIQPLFSAIGDAVGGVMDAVRNLFQPVTTTSEELIHAANAGYQFGQWLAAGIHLALTPLKYLLKGLEIGQQLWNWAFGDDDEQKSVTATRKIVQQVEQTGKMIPFPEQGQNRKSHQSYSRPLRASPSQVNQTRVNATITVNAAPGMSEQDIARQINRTLQEREHQAKVQQRGALYNYEEYATP